MLFVALLELVAEERVEAEAARRAYFGHYITIKILVHVLVNVMTDIIYMNLIV